VAARKQPGRLGVAVLKGQVDVGRRVLPVIPAVDEQQRVPGLNEVLIQHDYDIGGDRGQRLAALSADQPRPPLNRGALPKIALLALIWGSAFLWIKLADRGFSAVEVTLSRLALGAAVLFVVMLARRDKVPRSPRLWATIVIAALFANAVPYLLFAVAEQSVASSTAGIINATTPLWTLIVALAVRHQQSATRWQTAGLVVGFAGAVLIFTPWKTAAELFSAGGLECLAASMSYAVSYVYMDRFLARRGVGAIVLSACQLGAAALLLAIALAVSGVRTPHVTTESVAALMVLGIIGTGFAYVLNYQIITSEGATVASTVTYLLPVIAIVLGVLVLNEDITVTALAGIALVLTGVALTRRQRHPVGQAPGILNTTNLNGTSAAAPDHDHEGLVALSRH
jgi:drug/metabolite transporter (DMT)-like permease